MQTIAIKAKKQRESKAIGMAATFHALKTAIKQKSIPIFLFRKKESLSLVSFPLLGSLLRPKFPWEQHNFILLLKKSLNFLKL